ncbi:hypothetical protein [Azotobacter salinestris]|uniref:hypothetical protein n=1 Tax=Azotobacter salinestris TaxID=69964 RepID=UPI0032DF5982
MRQAAIQRQLVMEQATILLEPETSTPSLGVSMQILLSGLSEQACLACLGADTALPAQLSWNSANDFIAAAEAASPKEDERLWVWLYRAPWEFLAQAGQGEVATVLTQWQAEQRAVLGLRRALGQKLLLVNADRVAPAQLCTQLDLPEPQNSVLPKPSGLTPVIAGLFERVAPQYWDLYEMLEATAWLPEGEPQFRHDLSVPGLDGLPPLLQTLQDGLTLPALQTALAQAEQKHQRLEQALKESQQLSDRTEAERLALAGKNQQLQAQLQQAQDDLKKQQAQAISLTESHAAALEQQEQKLAESGKQLQQATDKLKKLEQELEKNRQATTKAESERQSLTEENDLLLAQLHQVQEELEKHYLDGKAQAAVLADTRQQLEQSTAKLKQAQESLKKQQAQAASSDKNHADALKQQEQKLAESGKQLQQATDKLKKLEQELEKAKQATAKLDGEHQAQLGKNQLLQTMLQQVQGELDQARQATAKTEAERQSLAAKSQKLQAQLQQVQEDLKKQQAQAASSDKNHAATLRQQEQKLAESGRQLQQATDKLKKLDQELEKNRQAATQAESDRQSLAEENDLLLAQLHQVQEELESYYLANRELQAVMSQSQQTLHRARAVVSRLVCNA